MVVVGLLDGEKRRIAARGIDRERLVLKGTAACEKKKQWAGRAHKRWTRRRGAAAHRSPAHNRQRGAYAGGFECQDTGDAPACRASLLSCKDISLPLPKCCFGARCST